MSVKQGSRVDIETFLHFHMSLNLFQFLLVHILFISINYIFGSGYSYGQSNLQSYICHIFYCLTAYPRTATSSANKRHCSVLMNIVPPRFAFTFLLIVSMHRLNKSVDNTLPCLSPTTVLKLCDIFPSIFTLLLNSSNVIFISLTKQLAWYSKLLHNFYQLISINTISYACRFYQAL